MNMNIEPMTAADAAIVTEGLVRYNLSQVPKTQDELFENISRKVVSEDGEVIAGCIAEMYYWNVIYVDILWVDERYRRGGIGTQLLQSVEAAAREKGCNLIHLDTFDFQAKDFYEKQGYEIFGVLEDCPPGHCRYYLKKNLRGDMG